MNKTAIVGLGNLLLKDEGVGIHALRYLKANHPDIAVDLIEAGTAGFSLFDLIKNYSKVIFLDAVEMGKPAGTIDCFSAEQLVALRKSFSLHEMGLAEVIKLGQELGEDFSHVLIFGVQPGEIVVGEGLSEAVKDGIPKLVTEVIKGV